MGSDSTSTPRSTFIKLIKSCKTSHQLKQQIKHRILIRGVLIRYNMTAHGVLLTI